MTTEELNNNYCPDNPSDFWMDGGGNSLVCDGDEFGGITTDDDDQDVDLSNVLC